MRSLFLHLIIGVFFLLNFMTTNADNNIDKNGLMLSEMDEKMENFKEYAVADELRKVSDEVGFLFQAGPLHVTVQADNLPQSDNLYIVLEMGNQVLKSKDEPTSIVQGNFGEFQFMLFRPVQPQTLGVTIHGRKDLKLVDEVLAHGKVALPIKDTITPQHTVLSLDLTPKGNITVIVDYSIQKPSGYVAPLDTDRTDAYTSYYEYYLANPNVKEFHEKYPEARNYTYILIKGLFCGIVPFYFSENYKIFKELGLDYVVAPINTQCGCRTNAEIIQKTILEVVGKTGRQVVLYGHSKGGPDMITAMGEYPELLPYIAGAIVMNSPGGGSPIVEVVDKYAKGLARDILKLFLGNYSAMMCMGYSDRDTFNLEHHYPATLPTVSLTTYTRFVNRSVGEDLWYVYFGMFESILNSRYGFRSDGVVVPEDGRLPGSSRVYLSDVWHAEAGMAFPKDNLKVAPCTQSLLVLLIEDIRGRG